MGWLVALGAVSILGQVVLLRELLVGFFGSELIYLLAFGLLLSETALGTLAGGRWVRPGERQIRALFLSFAALLPLLIAATRAVRILGGATPGAYLPFPQQLLGMGLLLLPFGFIVGLLFQRTASLYVEQRHTLAAAYAVESGGGLLGGGLATLLLAWGVQNLTAGLLGCLGAIGAALLPGRETRPGWLLPGAGVLGLLIGAALGAAHDLDRGLTGWNHPGLAATRDTPYGRVSVRQRAGQVAVFANDALLFESEGTGAEELAHLAALQVAAPRQVLVLGGVGEGLVHALLAHRPERVELVELDGAYLDLLRPYLTREVREALQAPAVQVTVADPREFLEDSGRYDLLIVAVGEPESGQTNRFYTREFFAACRDHLREGGVLAFRLGGAENLWTPALARRNASIWRALRAVFREVLVLPGSASIALAADGPLGRDPEILVERWNRRGLAARLVGPAYIRYLLTNDRVEEIAGMLAGTRAPENTDARPVCYQYTLILWLSRFFPALGAGAFPGSGEEGQAVWFWAPAGVWMLALTLSRRSAVCRRVLLAAGAGFAGMVLEGALILGYQVQQGALFQDLGILITVFMAGLSVGSLALDRWARQVGGVQGWMGAALVGDATILSLLAAGLFRAGVMGGLLVTTALLLASGFLVGALFAYASLRQVEGQTAAIGPLYAADLIGGGAGSLAGSLFLLPVFGLSGAALLAGLSLAPLLMLL